MTWLGTLDRLNKACVRAFRESVVRADGSEFDAIVSLPGADRVKASTRQRRSGVQPVAHIDGQTTPALHAETAAAEPLRERDRLMVRGAPYLIVRLTPDGGGMTRIEITPEQPTEAETRGAQWR
jgi:hypothetical protein